MTLSGDMAYLSAASSPRSSVSMRGPPIVGHPSMRLPGSAPGVGRSQPAD